MNTKTLLISILAATSALVHLSAKPDGQSKEGRGNRSSPEEIFAKVDADQSGGISADEAKGPMAKHFDKIDTDGNGEISQSEMAEAGKKMRMKRKGQRGERLQEMDANGNGSISKDEAGERLAERFDEIDADGDGEITREELKDAGKQRRDGSTAVEGKRLS